MKKHLDMQQECVEKIGGWEKTFIDPEAINWFLGHRQDPNAFIDPVRQWRLLRNFFTFHFS